MQPSASLLFALGLSVCQTVNAGSHVRRDEISLQNGYNAIDLKYAFHTPQLYCYWLGPPASNSIRFRALTPLSPCGTDEIACVNDAYAQCVEGHFALTLCPTGLVYVFPVCPH